MASRLTDQEINQAVGRIRSEYDHYIVHYHKTADAKRKFEERYTEALRSRADLTLFLGAEIQVVKTLLDRAQDELANPKLPPAKPVSKKVSYAERIVEQLREKIKDYPALGLPDHPEKSPDVDKLYGTLRWFRKELWEALYPVFLGKCASPALFTADVDLGALTLQGDKWPKEIETYVALYQGNAELSQVARAQNRCLLLGAQLLQRIRRLLDAAAAEPALTPQERDVVKKAQAFVSRVLSDFRLKELAARS
ncbi:MAG TPA: hypothetical protein VMB23_11010 [Spirochaetia bacterium]|jgi:hypothetical protein|nr:hypothetical protein [Spirochaetia bacterium]